MNSSAAVTLTTIIQGTRLYTEVDNKMIANFLLAVEQNDFNSRYINFLKVPFFFCFYFYFIFIFIFISFILFFLFLNLFYLINKIKRKLFNSKINL